MPAVHVQYYKQGMRSIRETTRQYANCNGVKNHYMGENKIWKYF
jgi:hypothetical protein